MSADRPAQRRYLALDALRGVAAFAVLFYHLRTIGAGPEAPPAIAIFASGYLAVDLFFVLSGFVIAHAYEARLRDGMTFSDFMTARFVRLQPVIAVGTMLGVAVALGQRMLGVEGAPGMFAILTAFPLNLMLLPDVLVPWGLFLFNPPAWSLFYELLANGAYALAWRRASGRPKTRRGSGRVFRPILAAICVTGGLGVLFSILITGHLDHGVVLADWAIALSRIVFSFTLGILLYRTRSGWLAVMPKLPVPILLLACLVLLAPAPSGPWRMAYDLAFVSLASPLLVMLGAATEPDFRTAGIAAWLGTISYPLYAIHAPVKHLVEAVLPIDFIPLFAVTALLASGAACLLARLDPALRRWLAGQIEMVRLYRRNRGSSAPRASGRT